MNDKLKAKTKLDKQSKKWNVLIEVDGKDIPVGHSVGGNELFFEHSKWDTEEDAIKWINESGKFELKEDK